MDFPTNRPMNTETSLQSTLRQYQRICESAVALLVAFSDADPPELLRLRAILEVEFQRFLELSGLDVAHCGEFSRHLSFLEHYLRKNRKVECRNDIENIVSRDLPTALNSFLSTFDEQPHLDPRLRDTVLPLIRGKHFDSAVRKIFVVLTEWLRLVFDVQGEVDGDDLIIQIFGKGGKLLVAVGDAKRQAMRNLISGFYGVYRNKYAHNDRQPSLAETRAILEMANAIILEVESLTKGHSDTL